MGVKYDPTQIITTCGAKAAIFIAFQALLDPGDEVLIPAPFWVSYPEQVKLAEGTPKVVETSEENGFKVSAKDIEAAITNKTKMLILNSPSNPTGSVYTKDELHSIIELSVSTAELSLRVQKHSVLDTMSVTVMRIFNILSGKD